MDSIGIHIVGIADSSRVIVVQIKRLPFLFYKRKSMQ